MADFRDNVPVRRTDVANKARYQEYKPELRQDFNTRCGYCDAYEGWRNSYYEIDHFIPQFLLKATEYADYENLVFSCRYCNNSKGRKWPTKDREQSNNGKEGFIDPCNEEYDAQFSRNSNGEIVPQSELGQWMYRELKLYLKRHSILWQMDKINILLNVFREFGLQNEPEYKDLFINMSCHFQDYINELKEENAQ